MMTVTSDSGKAEALMRALGGCTLKEVATLKLAIEAQLPIVAISTRDVMNFPAVLEEVAKRKVQPYVSGGVFPADCKLFWHRCVAKETLPLIELYSRLAKAHSTLILVNPPRIEEPMFDAGEAPVPKSLLKKFMMAVTSDPAKAENLMRGLGGVTLKEAAELSRLTMARDHSFTVQGLTSTRKEAFQGQQGLSQVETHQSFYEPAKELVKFAALERAFFLTGTDPRLIPRGLLASGKPGTGKTAAAKWLAEQWGVPLFRLDTGTTKSKWVGESEGNLAINLARADREAECIVLIDEVEKVFSTQTSDSSGTTASMMSQLLWWLAEHKSRVFS
jgi:hypothetical protein